MSRIFITGSSDGLGLLTAKALITEGHQVVLHARNENRAAETLKKVTGAETILTADLGSIEETKELAAKVNGLGAFDAVIHNAGVYQVDNQTIFKVNTLAPYILTCLIQQPKRLVYLSSGMHLQGNPGLDRSKTGNGVSYSDSKLQVLLLCKAVARKWPPVYANAVNPGWVPTKMGGRGAPDDLDKGFETQVWLATSNEAKALVSGRYFFHQKETRYHPDADSPQLQEQLLDLCAKITGVSFPDK
jgi:NAD(P)-dependent dehydrogenase (short-subunit alcohol dehydrogenase family)